MSAQEECLLMEVSKKMEMMEINMANKDAECAHSKEQMEETSKQMEERKPLLFIVRVPNCRDRSGLQEVL